MTGRIKNAALVVAGLLALVLAFSQTAIAGEVTLGTLQVQMNGEAQTFYAAVIPEIGPSSIFRVRESRRVMVEVYGFADPERPGDGGLLQLKFYTAPLTADAPPTAIIGDPILQAHVGYQPTFEPAFPQYLDNDNATKVRLSEFRIDGDSAYISGQFESLLYRFDAGDETAKVVSDKIVVRGSIELEARRK